jgi:cobalt-zinc-cadmium efflux system membrane fusion protein
MKGILIILFSLLALDVLAGNPISLNERQQSMLGVRLETIESIEQAWGLRYPAKVEVPNAQLRVLSTPFAGMTEALLVAEGDSVIKDQVVAIIQSTDLLEKLGDYIDAQSQLKLAASEYKRDKQLSKDGIISDRRLLETRARYTQTRTAADQARQILEYAGFDNDSLARIDKQRKISSRLELRATQDGVVLEQMVSPGEQLDALSAVFRIARLSPLWLEIHVPLEQVTAITPGMDVRVVDHEISGKVLTIGRMVHGTDQGVMVRAEVADESGQLRPGQFVQIEIAQRGDGQRYRIPRSALVRNEGESMVFVEVDESYVAKTVEVVAEEASKFIIQGGLNPRDRIVVSGTSALKSIWLEAAE